MKTINRRWRIVTTVLLASAALAACGGGGGGGDAGTSGTPVTSSSSFDFTNAYRARIQAGATENYNFSATNLAASCTGTATFVFTALANDTFDGASALSQSQTVTSASPTAGCDVGSGTGKLFYDVNDIPIGLSVNPGTSSEQYGTLATAGAYPGAVMVGAAGTLSTLNVYTDSTKTTKIGSRVVSYLIEPDTSTTAISNVTTKSYDNSSTPQLLSTEQKRFRMTAGTSGLSLVSDDVQFATTSTLHIVYTPR